MTLIKITYLYYVLWVNAIKVKSNFSNYIISSSKFTELLLHNCCIYM